MNQRKIKKCAKQSESRILKAQEPRQIIKQRPYYKRIMIGKTSATIPYLDRAGEVYSLESQNAPIVLKHKPKRTTKILSKILKTTGIEPLAEIGDIIIGKL